MVGIIAERAAFRTTFRSVTMPENRLPTHPGEILQEEFLHPLRMTQVALAKHLAIPAQRVNELVRGKRGVTPETAWLLAGALGATPQFWLNLQTNYDLALNRPDREIKPLPRSLNTRSSPPPPQKTKTPRENGERISIGGLSTTGEALSSAAGASGTNSSSSGMRAFPSLSFARTSANKI